MSVSGEANTAGVDVSSFGQITADPTQPLMNLTAVSSRMDSLQRFLSDSISRNVLLDTSQMEMVSSEISSAIQQAIVNGAALLALPQIPPPNPNFQLPIPRQSKPPMPPPPPVDVDLDESETNKLDNDYEVIELDSVELLAEHVHFCEICGKGFKRDANLRMHMRAHGDQFKRPEALAKPPAPAEDSSNSSSAAGGKETRFSCPFAGCNRNQQHKKFRALKSVICVRNHFKRSHCPKMYSCNRCNKKNFSVLADLKSHLKHCGESKWRCTCGTTFSRKDKLFGHMALFEGHMPAIHDDTRSKTPLLMMEEDQVVVGGGGVDDASFFDGDLFPGMDESNIQEMFGASSSPDFVQQFYNM